MATFDIKIKDIELIIERIKLAPKDVDVCIRKAINKTARQISTLVSREVAKEASVKVSLIRQRFKLIAAQKEPKAKIIIATKSLPAVLLGDPSPHGKGITAGSHFFLGGFHRFSKRRNGKKRAFIFRRKGKHQYPLVEERILIRDKIDLALSHQETQLQQRLLKNVEREVKRMGGLFD